MFTTSSRSIATIIARYPQVRQDLSFGGSVTVVAGDFGGAATSIGKSGDIVRESPDNGSTCASAELNMSFGDNSSVKATLTSDSAGVVQIDIVSGATEVSFTDDYRFEAG